MPCPSFAQRCVSVLCHYCSMQIRAVPLLHFAELIFAVLLPCVSFPIVSSLFPRTSLPFWTAPCRCSAPLYRSSPLPCNSLRCLYDTSPRYAPHRNSSALLCFSMPSPRASPRSYAIAPRLFSMLCHGLAQHISTLRCLYDASLIYSRLRHCVAPPNSTVLCLCSAQPVRTGHIHALPLPSILRLICAIALPVKALLRRAVTLLKALRTGMHRVHCFSTDRVR